MKTTATRAQILRLVGLKPGEEPWMPDARAAEVWEADVTPVNVRLHKSPRSNPAMATVGAGGFIVHSEMVPDRPIGPAARARVVGDAVLAAVRYVGAMPSRLHVRDEALARELAPGLAARGIAVAVAEMPDLDEAIQEALERLMEDPRSGFGTTPATWGPKPRPRPMRSRRSTAPRPPSTARVHGKRWAARCRWSCGSTTAGAFWRWRSGAEDSTTGWCCTPLPKT